MPKHCCGLLSAAIQTQEPAKSKEGRFLQAKELQLRQATCGQQPAAQVLLELTHDELREGAILARRTRITTWYARQFGRLIEFGF